MSSDDDPGVVFITTLCGLCGLCGFLAGVIVGSGVLASP
jgi:hypothetical protein